MAVVTQQLPAYAYNQYSDDPDIVAFFDAYNGTILNPIGQIYTAIWSGGVATMEPSNFPNFPLGFQFTVQITNSLGGAYDGIFLATVVMFNDNFLGFSYPLPTDPGPDFEGANYQNLNLQPASQGYLDLTNSIIIPDYLNLSSPLLDWVGESIYGQSRSNVANASPILIGPYNTYQLNTLQWNQSKLIEPIGESSIILSDANYISVLLWNNYKGDGYQCTIRWLKRRVQRFLYGIFVVDGNLTPNPDQTYDVSIVFTGPYAITITVPASNANSSLLKACLLSKVLEVPQQYLYTVVQV